MASGKRPIPWTHDLTVFAWLVHQKSLEEVGKWEGLYQYCGVTLTSFPKKVRRRELFLVTVMSFVGLTSELFGEMKSQRGPRVDAVPRTCP